MAKKIVYNGCYGGFGLSLKAQKRYLELQGKKAFFYKQTKYKHSGGTDEYKKVIDMDDRSMFMTTFTKDFGDVVEKFTNEDYEKYYFYDHDLDRKDIYLVQVVEELGSEEASGDCAKLRIQEIDDDEMYRICEYDGNEWIETQATIDWSN